MHKDGGSEAEDRDVESTADEPHLLEGRVAEVRGYEQDEAEDMNSPAVAVEGGGGTLGPAECRWTSEVGCHFWRGRFQYARPHSAVGLLVVVSPNAKSSSLHAAEEVAVAVAAVVLDVNGPVHNKVACKALDRRPAFA